MQLYRANIGRNFLFGNKAVIFSLGNTPAGASQKLCTFAHGINALFS
jgi:hypothetical protein